MTQNANTVTRGEDLPQILPLIMEMELQRKYILAGILKVDIMFSFMMLLLCSSISFMKYNSILPLEMNYEFSF